MKKVADESQEPDLTDGRKLGEFCSRYDLRCWCQICLELAYLLVLLAVCVMGLINAISIPSPSSAAGYPVLFTEVRVSAEVARWIALAIAGMIGGITFDLKWLYHSVAKNSWNRDRVLWRLIVPINSAIVSVFFGLLLSSGLVPFVMNDTFQNIYAILGGGFVFGHFSDNILAALQNFSRRLFGTLES